MENVYGSDVAISALERLGIDCVAFNPGASFRGLHESLVHHGGMREVLCLAENTAVAVAHGYAKSALRPMAVFLHNLVGLQSGSMGLFNAWIDQVPMLVVGGSGPSDRAQRRPWIDWIHTAHSQGELVRDFVKWDAEPTSVPGMLEDLALAHHLAVTAPAGPTYVALDGLLQEREAPAVDLSVCSPRDPARIGTPIPDLERLTGALTAAERPVILADFVGRSAAGYRALQDLAALTGAPVVDLGGRHNFPNAHPADGTPQRRELLREADLVLALDVRDLRWSISDIDVAGRSFHPLLRPEATVMSLGLSGLLHRGWIEQGGTVPGSVDLVGDTEVVLPQVVDMLRDRPGSAPAERSRPAGRAAGPEIGAATGPISLDMLSSATWAAVREGPWQLAHGNLRGVVRKHWDLDPFNCYLGASGGAGLGYGPGATIGAALAQADEDTLVVSLQPDGDFLYTASALWTAANQSLAMLVVIVNNRVYGQDLMHQLTMSRERGRPESHARVGIDIDDPAVDFAGLARSQGVEGIGPITDASDLLPALSRAAKAVREERRPVVVDVHVN